MRNQLRRLVRPLARVWPRTRWYRALLARLAAGPWDGYLMSDFVRGEYGSPYGVTAPVRRKLLAAFERNTREIPAGTSVLHHLVLARAILSIPPEVKGDVVECGCWKGASTASLSLVCGLVRRRLLVCDSFEGLPDDAMTPHLAPHFGIYGYYRKGMFAGRLEEVRANVTRYGDVRACTFIQGFFAESLRALTEPVALAFLDVDLVSSTQDCLRYVWPLLVEGGHVYTDDAGDLEVVRVFFDDGWWSSTLGSRSPGYVGSGCGLPLNPLYSSLGYARKLSGLDPSRWARAPHLYYPDDEGQRGRDS